MNAPLFTEKAYLVSLNQKQDGYPNSNKTSKTLLKIDFVSHPSHTEGK